MKINSQQLIIDYSEINRFFPDNITEDYMAMKRDILAIVSAVNNGAFEPQFGDESPEGVVISNENRTYFDMSGANAIMYVNENIGVNTGWKQVQ